MKVEKNSRAYWLNRFNKFFSLGTGVILLGILSFFSKKDLIEVAIPVICGIPIIVYALFCRKRANNLE
ncbi:hypothetical protein HLB30_07275 [Peptostreptococcus russellii]|uniref:Uncharacterized protein n=1 Tax=Peptostreptococcus russellii TaxID=215200 RepID=A0A1H8K8E2_9FIRM|nr:hypothetical protein [Peptostreptococcus russellii]MBC2578314.1 hypothetical protein [Peptostreptococcus russellii]SEN89233.1 hypothetical protein SAMN05216454_1253 [Peptostreptococcus russellii]